MPPIPHHPVLRSCMPLRKGTLANAERCRCYDPKTGQQPWHAVILPYGHAPLKRQAHFTRARGRLEPAPSRPTPSQQHTRLRAGGRRPMEVCMHPHGCRFPTRMPLSFEWLPLQIGPETFGTFASCGSPCMQYATSVPARAHKAAEAPAPLRRIRQSRLNPAQDQA